MRSRKTLARKTLGPAAAATALFIAAQSVHAQTAVPLFQTVQDWGGSSYNPANVTGQFGGTPTGQIGWQGFGDRDSDYDGTPDGSEGAHVTPAGSPVGPPVSFYSLAFNGPSLGTPITANGVGDYDGNNDPGFGLLYEPGKSVGTTDANQDYFDPFYNPNQLTNYAGGTSPAGSLELKAYQGGYTQLEGANEAVGGVTAGVAGASTNYEYINAIEGGAPNATQNTNNPNKGIFKIDFTSPLGGTTLNTSTYFEIGFGFFYNTSNGTINTPSGNTGTFISGWGSPGGSGLSVGGDSGANHGAPGSYVVNNGTYFTAYIPYSIAGDVGTFSNLVPTIVFNSDPSVGAGYTVGPSLASGGNIYIQDISVLPLNNNYEEWNQTGGGTWGLATNWQQGDSTQGSVTNGAVPHIGGDIASFLGNADTQDQGITSNSTITLDGVQTVGVINFQSTNSYTLAAGTGGLLVMDNGGLGTLADINVNNVNSGSGAMHFISVGMVLDSNTNINPVIVGGVTISGNISGPGGINKNGAGSLVLSGVNTYTGPTNFNAGTFTIANKSALSSGTALTIGSTVAGSAGVSFSLAANSGRYTLAGLAVNAGSTLDVANNGITVNYGSLANDPVTNIAAALASGYNAGTWTGTGIQSTIAALHPTKFAIGYIDGDRAGDALGKHVAANQLIVRYTLAGDAFLEGSVGFDDLVAVAENFGATGRDWAQGDFNYDPNGSVGFADLVDVAENFGLSSGVSNGDSGGGLSPAWQSVQATAVVPEPATFGIAAIAGLGLLGRRRRSKV